MKRVLFGQRKDMREPAYINAIGGILICVGRQASYLVILMLNRLFKTVFVVLFVAVAATVLSGCGKMNATMSGAVMLGVAAAAYGTYYYYYEYLDSGADTQLRVVNDSTNNLKVWVDGAQVGTVEKGGVENFDVTPGSHNLGAGVDTATITTTQNFVQGTVFTWTLTD